MALWNNNDREESKPTWLNKIAKRLCTRTVRGWEMPLMGSFFGYGETDAGDDKKGAIYTELLVTIPGAASRGSGGLDHALGGQGLTVSTDLPNYAPYFTCPFSGDSATAGGPASAGVSHDSFTYVLDAGVTPGAGYGYQYGVDKFGVSSLGGLTGVTAYIKVCVNDANFTNTLSMGLSGTHTQFTLYTGETNLKNVSNVPARVFNAFFGATSTDDKVSSYRYDNIGVLVAAGTTANGNKTVRLKVNDGAAGVTAYSTFTLQFDRPAGVTTSASGTLSDYTYYNYDKSR
jgi:hypothetical protein